MRRKVNTRRIYEQNYGPIPVGYHIHHIDGDPDNNHPNNLIKVTLKEHALIHHNLYQLYGRWQDKVAWHGLSGMIPCADIVREAQRYKSPEHRAKLSASLKGRKRSPFTEEHKRRIGCANIGNKRPDLTERNNIRWSKYRGQ